jgi:hypothetical protein
VLAELSGRPERPHAAFQHGFVFRAITRSYEPKAIAIVSKAGKWDEYVVALERRGFRVKRASSPLRLPRAVQKRFDWVPTELQRFTETHVEICSADERAWFVTEAEFAGRAASAFVWDEFERMSQTAARGDVAQLEAIKTFWTAHFPLMLSVKSGYAYFALERGTLRVVVGEESEFEQATVIAATFDDFIAMLASDAEELSRWV